MSRFTIHDLAATIDARAAAGGEASYTRKLLDKGAEHCAKKLGEEAVETVIASGGVGHLDHLVDGIREGHATAVLAASIFHFGEFTIREAKDHMVRAGLPMRLDP